MTYDVTKNISAYEEGKLNDDSVYELFQYLVDTDQVWEMKQIMAGEQSSWRRLDALRFPTLG